MPPVLDLSVAVVAVRALGISRGIWRYCERLAGHDIALRGAATVRTHVYARLTGGPAGRLRKGAVLERIGTDIDELAETVVRSVIPAAVAAVLGIAATAVVALISIPAAAVMACALLVADVLAPALAARAARARRRAERGHVLCIPRRRSRSSITHRNCGWEDCYHISSRWRATAVGSGPRPRTGRPLLPPGRRRRRRSPSAWPRSGRWPQQSNSRTMSHPRHWLSWSCCRWRHLRLRPRCPPRPLASPAHGPRRGICRSWHPTAGGRAYRRNAQRSGRRSRRM